MPAVGCLEAPTPVESIDGHPAAERAERQVRVAIAIDDLVLVRRDALVQNHRDVVATAREVGAVAAQERLRQQLTLGVCHKEIDTLCHKNLALLALVPAIQAYYSGIGKQLAAATK